MLNNFKENISVNKNINYSFIFEHMFSAFYAKDNCTFCAKVLKMSIIEGHKKKTRVKNPLWTFNFHYTSFQTSRPPENMWIIDNTYYQALRSAFTRTCFGCSMLNLDGSHLPEWQKRHLSLWPAAVAHTHDDAIHLIYSSVNNAPKNPPFPCWFGSFSMQTDYRYCDMAPQKMLIL